MSGNIFDLIEYKYMMTMCMLISRSSPRNYNIFGPNLPFDLHY